MSTQSGQAVRRGARARPAAAAPPRGCSRAASKLTLPVLLLLPAMTIIVGLVGYPLVTDGLPVVHRHAARRPDLRRRATWVGLENYKEVFTDEHLRTSLVNTVVFGTACVIGTMVLGLRGRAAAQPAAARQLVLRDRRAAAVGGAGAGRERDLASGCSTPATASSTGRWSNLGFEPLPGLRVVRRSQQRVRRDLRHRRLAVVPVHRAEPAGRAADDAARRRSHAAAVDGADAVAALPAGHAAAAAPDRRRAGDLLDDLGLQDLRPGLRDGARACPIARADTAAVAAYREGFALGHYGPGAAIAVVLFLVLLAVLDRSTCA